jgi:hypothetical protein
MSKPGSTLGRAAIKRRTGTTRDARRKSAVAGHHSVTDPVVDGVLRAIWQIEQENDCRTAPAPFLDAGRREIGGRA